MTAETNNKVLSILKNIKKCQENCVDSTSADQDEVMSEDKQPAEKKKPQALRGLPKSGRFWKSEKEKFSTINKTKGLKQDFQKKTALRLELKRTKEISKQLQEELKQKELERKERRRQNIKRTEENKKKSEVVQVITNTAKLKRMRKKQLRFIQKRDTNKEVEASK
ncbi:coiled-coil domain-containing protein 86 [Pectinophora gossypiella]|uniref:Coiled-coil domain-containing protein 86 n=1 Tax=Pectinophora gossypiella TaxID=13191 RepID=A0A1E1WQS7_PECGO|nr:coiled-coil domain-containing protein 86 [Pectinophora gossypiella]